MSYEDLLIWQYKDKPKALSTIRLLMEEIARTRDGFSSLPLALDIDTAEGVNLDLVGKHVGQSRIIQDAVAREYFAFVGAPGGGFQKGKSGGSRFYRYGDPLMQSVVLGDEDYRFLIRCRITKNYMVGTIPEMMDALDFIFGGSADVFDGYDMSISITVDASALSSFLLFAVRNLDILPRPAGVRISYYLVTAPQPFGFYASPGAFGFNEGVFTRLL